MEKAMAIEGYLMAVVIFAERIQATRAINACLLKNPFFCGKFRSNIGKYEFRCLKII
jgi:hypothetical protein